MLKIQSLSHLSKALAALWCCLVCALTQASPLETWAWTQSIGLPGHAVYLADLAQDNAGDCFVLYSVSGGDNYVVGLRGYSKGGTPLFAKTVVSTSKPNYAGKVYVSKPAFGSQYVYVSAQYTDANAHAHAYYAKYDTAGHFLWSHLVSGGMGAAYPLGVDMDAGGNTYLATACDSPSWHLDVRTIDSAGVMLHHGSNFMIQPYTSSPKAFHVDGYWLVSGDAYGPSAAMWGRFSDDRAVLAGHRQFKDHYDADYKYHYLIEAYPFNGTVLEVLNARLTPVPSGTIRQEYVVGRYTYGAVPIWRTPVLTGFIDRLWTTGGSDPIYATSYGSNEFVQQIDEGGTVLWTQPVSANFSTLYLAADPTGFFLGTWEYFARTESQILRYDSSGTVQRHYPPPGGPVTSLISLNGDTFIGYLRDGNGNGPQLGVVQRFVAGVALNSVGGPSTISSGSPVNVTVSLNANATVDTSVSLHSTNPYLLFSNGTQDIVVTVSGGTSSTFTQVHALPPPNTQPAEVIGIGNGVHRAAYLTITM